MSKTLKLNYDTLRALAVFFSKSRNPLGQIILWVIKGLCCHAGFITLDRMQKFATEETGQGLVEDSLEKYTSEKNKIVYVGYWIGWDEAEKREKALDYLAEIRRKRAEDSRYDFWGLLSFVLPWVKPDKNRQWCSENVLSILDKFGFNSGWKGKKPPSPQELLDLMQKRSDVKWINPYLPA